MQEYQKMYYTLFNAITDALELLERCAYQEAIIALMHAQQETEQAYMEAGEIQND